MVLQYLGRQGVLTVNLCQLLSHCIQIPWIGGGKGNGLLSFWMSQGQLVGMESQSIQQRPLLKGVSPPGTLDFRQSHWLLVAAVEGIAHNA